MKTTYNGERYMMAIEFEGNEYVARYTNEDMLEMFTEDQIRILDEEGSVVVWPTEGNNPTMWIDMISASRSVLEG